MSARHFEIISHRGASFDAPENTLASFRLAWEQGADAVECDVRLSKDGQIVVCHDEDTTRLASVAKRIADQTVAELRQLDVGRWKGTQFHGERMPTLAEALATAPADKRMLIEVKCGPEIGPALRRLLAEAPLKPWQTAIISFSTDVIAAVKDLLPDVVAYWVVRLRNESGLRWTADDLIAAAKAMNADGLDLSADPSITPDFVRQGAAAGLPIYVWTVNDPLVAKSLRDAGVAGIATDRPGWMREQLDQDGGAR